MIYNAPEHSTLLTLIGQGCFASFLRSKNLINLIASVLERKTLYSYSESI